MSIDRYFARDANGEWIRVDDECAKHHTGHWVDICHGPSKDGETMYMIDERH